MGHPDSDDERRSADAAAPPSAPPSAQPAAQPAAQPSTFDDIVAGWLAEGSVPSWPDEPGPTTTIAVASPTTQPTPPQPAPPAAPPTPVAGYPRPEDEHFIPPDPPPLPHLGPRAIVGLGLLVLGIILAVTPQVVGLDEPAGLALGLLSLALGLGWLVLGAWPSGDAEEDDDGAVL
ncbi:MAG TPA: hypothetical protein VGH89_37775 [Pseudonocardia sp.]